MLPSTRVLLFVGEDEGGQASSSLAVIHMVGAAKSLLKLLVKSPHLLAKEKGRGEYKVITKKSSLWPFSSLLFIEAPYQLNPNGSYPIGYWISVQLSKPFRLVDLYLIISHWLLLDLIHRIQ